MFPLQYIKLVLKDEIKITQKEGAREDPLDLPHWSNDRLGSHYSGSFLQTERFSCIPPHPHSPWRHRADPQRLRKLWVEQWCLLNSLCLQSLGYTDTDLEIGHKVSLNKHILPTYALKDEIPKTWKISLENLSQSAFFFHKQSVGIYYLGTYSKKYKKSILKHAHFHISYFFYKRNWKICMTIWKKMDNSTCPTE